MTLSPVDYLGYIFFGLGLVALIALILSIWSNLSGRQGSDRHERSEAWVRGRLAWMRKHPGAMYPTPSGHWETRVQKYMPQVLAIVDRWGFCPDDIVEEIDKLTEGK